MLASNTSEPEIVSVFAQAMADAEDSHSCIEEKVICGSGVLTGKSLDRGSASFPGFRVACKHTE